MHTHAFFPLQKHLINFYCCRSKYIKMASLKKKGLAKKKKRVSPMFYKFS